MVEVPESIEFAALLSLLEAKYGRQLNITFKDDEDDYVTIDDHAALVKAIAFFKKYVTHTHTRCWLYHPRYCNFSSLLFVQFCLKSVSLGRRTVVARFGFTCSTHMAALPT